MKYQDIPRFFEPPHYCITSQWDHIEHVLKNWNDHETPGALGLNLDPDFQRGHVWTEDKQIAYVEYCLKGGEAARELLFNHPNWMTSFKGEMVLVDGKQRLEAVRKFVRNDLAIFGDNYLNDFDHPKRLLRSTSLLFRVNNLKTRKDILTWYLQLNTGGVVHTNEEIDKVKVLLAIELKK